MLQSLVGEKPVGRTSLQRANPSRGGGRKASGLLQTAGLPEMEVGSHMEPLKRCSQKSEVTREGKKNLPVFPYESSRVYSVYMN